MRVLLTQETDRISPDPDLAALYEKPHQARFLELRRPGSLSVSLRKSWWAMQTALPNSLALPMANSCGEPRLPWGAGHEVPNRDWRGADDW